ncbi:MAG TPA: hypothetical protein VF968_05565 [Actinomycetota bacterium]
MRVRAPLAALIGTLVLVASCTKPSATLVSGLPDGTVLTLPRGWQMVDVAADPLAVNNPLNVGPEVIDAKVFSPDPNELAGSSIVLDGSSPYGFLHVRQFTQEQLAETSIRDLRNGVFPFDKTRAKNPAVLKVIDQSPVSDQRGFGEHLLFSVRLPSAATSSGVTTSVTIDQTVIMSPATDHVSVLFVACTSDCFELYQSQIDGIVNSWQTTTT